MSLLSVVTAVTQRLAITVPNAVAGSQDPQIIQLMALLNEEGEELAARYQWQKLNQQATFTTVATEVQGSLSTIAPGYKFIINDTIWNRDLRRPVFGPLGPQYWQQMQAMFMQGPWNQYRIINDEIHFVPVPAAGEACFFEYTTSYWCESSGGTPQASYQADTDVALLDENILILGLIWRWKAAKGLDYTEDFNKYDKRVLNAMTQDASKPVLNMGEVKFDIYPGVWVPSGNWN